MKKIMFNDECGLTQAVLDGRKTMTRRGCKYDRPNETYDIVFPVFEPNDYDNDGNITSPLNYAFGWKNNEGDFTGWNIPKYKVGEVVAIAQSYGDCGNMPDYELIEQLGFEAVSPLEVSSNPDASYEEHIGGDITALLQCDAVLFLEGWHLSNGCSLEHSAAGIYEKERLFSIGELKRYAKETMYGV